MSQQAKSSLMNVIADPFEFAREGGVLVGTVPVAKLERLQDLLANPAGDVAWRVVGCVEDGVVSGSRWFLDLEVDGVLQLVCQRCLGAYEYPLKVFNRLELMVPGSELPEEELEDDGCDAIEVSANLSVEALVEEEILLALPQAPRHEKCALPGEGGVALGRESPFAALAVLKDSSGQC